ncbi:MAK10-like protein [Tanacetum coccineum]
MEAHLAPNSSIQVNKIASSYEICSGPHNTQYCMENPEQAFVDYASSRTDEVGGKWYTFKPEQNNIGDTYNPSWKSHPNLRLSKFEADFKQQQGEMTNKIDTVLKAINDRIMRALPSDTVKKPKLNVNPTSIVLSILLEVLAHALIYNTMLDKYVESLELGKNRSAFIQGKMPEKMKDSGLFTFPCSLGDAKPFDTLANLGSCVNLIPLYLFKKLKIGLLEETDHVFGLEDGTKSYPVGIIKNVEVHIGKLKLIDDFYVIDMDKDPITLLLVGRGFLATANATNRGVGDCQSGFWWDKVCKGVGRQREKKREQYGIGVRTPYYAKKDFTDYHLPGEWKIARDVELNPFKDVLVFRRMVEFLGVIPINLKRNMWESEDLIENRIDWNKPPKRGDAAWHVKIRLIDPDGEEFTKTF